MKRYSMSLGNVNQSKIKYHLTPFNQNNEQQKMVEE